MTDCICPSKGLLLMKVHLTPKNRGRLTSRHITGTCHVMSVHVTITCASVFMSEGKSFINLSHLSLASFIVHCYRLLHLLVGSRESKWLLSSSLPLPPSSVLLLPLTSFCSVICVILVAVQLFHCVVVTFAPFTTIQFYYNVYCK